METEDEQIRVKFITDIEKYQISEGELSIPLSLTRKGLSEIINQLKELDPPVPFDFLLEDQLIRSSLQKFISKNNISVENVLNIKYFPLIQRPEQNKTKNQPEWVSCVSSSHSWFCTGCYDNILRLYNEDFEDVMEFQDHSLPIKSTDMSIDDEDENTVLLFSGSQDQTIYVYEYDKETNSIIVKSSCKGHKSSVESLSYSNNSSKLLSGGFNGSVCIWDIDRNNLNQKNDNEEEDDSNKKVKRKKLNDNSDISTLNEIISPICTLNGHTDNISSCEWYDSDKVITGSWDHTLSTWDIETTGTINTFRCNKPILSLTYNKDNNIILTGHNDNEIRMWDIRNKEDYTKRHFKSHNGWISSVKFNEINCNYFFSCSYDGNIKIWDVRGNTPLYTINVNGNDEDVKLLCGYWKDEKTILSGGSDCKISSYHIDFSANM